MNQVSISPFRSLKTSVTPFHAITQSYFKYLSIATSQKWKQMFLFNIRTGNASVTKTRRVTSFFPLYRALSSLYCCLMFDESVSKMCDLRRAEDAPFPFVSFDSLLFPCDVAGCSLTFPRLPAFIPLDLSNLMFLTAIGIMWRLLDLSITSISLLLLLSWESARRWTEILLDDVDGKMVPESAMWSKFDTRLEVSTASQSDSSPVIGTCRK